MQVHWGDNPKLVKKAVLTIALSKMLKTFPIGKRKGKIVLSILKFKLLCRTCKIKVDPVTMETGPTVLKNAK